MSAVAGVRTRDLWLHSPKFDLTFLIGSAVLASVPLTLLYVFHVQTSWINYLVAAVVGGPHLYSTFGMTFMATRSGDPTALLREPCVSS